MSNDDGSNIPVSSSIGRFFASPVKSNPAKISRVRRAILLLAALFFAVAVFVPGISALRACHRLVSAVGSAASIRLEEFQGDSILSSQPLQPELSQSVLCALPLLPDLGIPGIIKPCYIPHHRIIGADSSGATRCAVSVCFGCEQFAFDDSDVAPTPFSWRQPLRRLFVQHGVLIRSEYSDVN